MKSEGVSSSVADDLPGTTKEPHQLTREKRVTRSAARNQQKQKHGKDDVKESNDGGEFVNMLR